MVPRGVAAVVAEARIKNSRRVVRGKLGDCIFWNSRFRRVVVRNLFAKLHRVTRLRRFHSRLDVLLRAHLNMRTHLLVHLGVELLLLKQRV